MNGSNRRTFLKTAGVGAAAAGAAALAAGGHDGVDSAAGRAEPASAPRAALPAGAYPPMVAYVQNVASGQVSVMVQGREVTIVDHQLVAALAHAVHSSELT